MIVVVYSSRKVSALQMEPFRDSLGFNLKVAFTVVNRHLKKVLNEMGITLPEYTILRSLGDRDGMSLFEISKIARCLPSQLTPGVKSLKKKGLLNGIISSSDKRVNHMFLTEAGRSTLKRLEVPRNQMVNSLGLTPAELKTLLKLTKKIVAIDEGWQA